MFEAAEILGLHVSTIYRAANEGRLPVIQLADKGSIQIRRSDLEPKADALRAVAPWRLPEGPRRPGPKWLLGDYDKYVEQREQRRFQTQPFDHLRFESTAEGAVVEGRMLPYGEWTQINSPSEGRFMQQVVYGSLRSEVEAGRDRIKVLFEHGTDPILGTLQVAQLTSMREQPDGVYFSAELLRGVPTVWSPVCSEVSTRPRFASGQSSRVRNGSQPGASGIRCVFPRSRSSRRSSKSSRSSHSLPTQARLPS
jgi:excisionase family DNA binding protein